MRLNRALVLSLTLLLGCSSPQDKPDPAPVEQTAEEGDVDAETSTPAESDEPVFPITEEKVSFQSGDLTLKGEVIRPDADGVRSGVIFVHDSGPMGRDGVVSDVFGVELPVEVPVYRSIAEEVASRGHVVLLYDKRTCVEASAPWCTYPREFATAREDLGTALVEDAVSAAEFLAGRDDVDSVSFVGHGQGAEVALVAARQVDASGVVMLAPSMHGPRELAAHQLQVSIALLEARIEKVGDTPEADLLKKQLGDLRKQSDQLEKSEGGEDVLGVSGETWSDLGALHQRFLELLPQTTPPVHILVPGTDPGEPEDTAERLKTVVAPHGEAAYQLIPRLTRAMVVVDEEEDPGVVAAEAVEFVVQAL